MNELLIGRIFIGLVAVGYFGYKLWQFWQSRQAAKASEAGPIMIEANDMFDDELIEESYQYSLKVQEDSIATFDLGSYDRFLLDQESSTLNFYKNDVPVVRANVQILGSHSLKNGTWLWSALNESILDQCFTDLVPFFELIDVAGAGALIGESVDDEFVSNAVSVCIYVMQAKGYYRAPSADKNTYLIMTDIDWVA